MTVAIDLAELAKEKGFNRRTHYYFYPNDNRDGYHTVHKSHVFPKQFRTVQEMHMWGELQLTIPAPFPFEIQDWLREIHNIHVIVEPVFNSDMSVYFYGMRVRTPAMYAGASIGDIGESYEEALTKGVKAALLQIKNELGTENKSGPQGGDDC